jgi:proline racemase
MSVLEAMGILGDAFINEGLLGTSLVATEVRRQTVNEMPIIVPLIESAVTITGLHEFLVDDGGPAFRI